MKKLLKFLCPALCVALVFSSAACGSSPNGGNGGNSGGNGEDNPIVDVKELDAAQNYNNVSSYQPSGSIHDPAAIKVGDTYYLFGTNSTTKASSKDLIRWTDEGQVFAYDAAYASGGVYKEQTNAQGVVTSCAKEMVDYVMQYYGGSPRYDQTSGYWAPDIIKYGNEFRLYFCISLFGKKQSAIGFATSSSIDGPFVYKGIVLKSKASDPNTYPNAIDPNVVVDKTGRMWMSYGSFFGGIYIIELDPATGFIKSGSGHIKSVDVSANAGTKLCAGSYEGPCIIYNPTTDYYYLFVSYGNLEKNYNVRVGRSREITGPYTYGLNDGQQMQKTGGSEDKHGNKVIGGYNFGFEESASRMAPGHCSVLYDNGSYYMINHVRRSGTNFHYVQVHKMFFNENGWPCVFTNTYAGETKQDIGTANLTGAWKFITYLKNDNNMTGVNGNTVRALDMTVGADKKVSGALTGTVQAYKGGIVHITVSDNNFGDGEEPYLGTYYGFVVSGYDHDNTASTLFISAVNEYGYTLVAEKAI